MLSNWIVAASNFISLIFAVYSDDICRALLFLSSGSASFAFHLFETDEVYLNTPHILPFHRVSLPGIFGRKFDYGRELLLMDRLFAAALFGYVMIQCISIVDTHDLNKKHAIILLATGTVSLLYSDLFTESVLFYTIVHSIWHIIAFSLAAMLCNEKSHLWTPKQTKKVL